MENAEESGVQLISAEELPQERIERQERVEEVQKALLCLSDEHREVLVLREMQEMSYEEIAQTLGISVGTVRSRISRGRENLRKILLQGNFFEKETSKLSGREG